MKKKTNKQFVEELKNKWGSNVTPLSIYDGNKNKINFMCNICGHNFQARPNDILSGWKRWCPKCSNRIMGENNAKTNDEYTSDLRKIHGNKIIAIEQYGENRNASILHRCNVCGYEWKATPHNLLSGEGCPNCKKKTISNIKRKPVEQYIQEIKEKHGNNISLIGEYISGETKTLHRCNVCGYEWHVNPHNIISGSGCPVCNLSRGERAIVLFLESNKVNFEIQKKFDSCKNEKMLPFDFYLPDYNIVIEYQGEQHFKPIEHFGGEERFKERKINDEIKKEWCSKKENPNLIEITFNDDINSVLSETLNLTKI